MWVLSNRKAPHLVGQVAMLDAREAGTRSPGPGERRASIDAGVADIALRYRAACTAGGNADTGGRAPGVAVVPVRSLGHRRVTVERPLRKRFEISVNALRALAASRPMVAFADREAVLSVLRPLAAGGPSASRADFARRLDVALAGLAVPDAVVRTVWAVAGVPDPDGEVQRGGRGRGAVLADARLRSEYVLPLDRDPEEFLRREVRPSAPDAWVAHDRTRVGYEIPFAAPLQPPAPEAENPLAIAAEIGSLLREALGHFDAICEQLKFRPEAR